MGAFIGDALGLGPHWYYDLAELRRDYGEWITGVRSLDPAGLARPCGPAEGPFAEYPMAALVLHINREAIHHGAEIALLRDLYLRRSTRDDSAERAG